MKKLLRLFALIVGLSAVLCLTSILIFNKGFYVGVKAFIPEGHQWIRVPEIIMGLIGSILLIKIIADEIYDK